MNICAFDSNELPQNSFNPISAGGIMFPHYFQMAISPRKKWSRGPKFLDVS